MDMDTYMRIIEIDGISTLRGLSVFISRLSWIIGLELQCLLENLWIWNCLKYSKELRIKIFSKGFRNKVSRMKGIDFKDL